MSDTKRKVADCRLYPSEKGCTLTIEGTEDEVLEAATQHAVTAHGHTNSPELREQLRALLKDVDA
jgi:predicted small metal-binding protein